MSTPALSAREAYRYLLRATRVAFQSQFALLSRRTVLILS